jgi:hypothetical protein
MLTKTFKAAVVRAGLAAAVLLLGSGVALAQSINLTAAPTSAAMPDGTVVPMWGYSCGALVSASTATCAALNPASVTTAATATTGAVGTWSPVVITVPTAAAGTATTLTINLTNNLLFTPAGTGATPNAIPTSIVIVGQVGGGLGNAAPRSASPSHATAQECPSWFIAANPPGTPCTAPTPGVTTNTPPVQLPRVQSFSTEVEAVSATTAATCTAVTASTTTASTATGCATLTWSNLKPGTYLLESGTHPSIQVPMGLIGVLVVTNAPSGATAGTAYPGTTTAPAIPAVTYNAELPLEFSEIDPVQNAAVAAAVATNGFGETNVWSGMFGGCGNQLNADGTSNLAGATTAGSTPFGTCYPPAVNYTPFYFLINGVAFNKTNAGGSLFAATAGAGVTTGIPIPTPTTNSTVLVRLVNAGLRMHVPSIVRSQTQGFNGAGVPATVGGFTLIAEDGNPVPGVQVAGNATVPAAPRVQTDVFMAAGKVFDVMVNVPAAASTALPVYARDLGLSADSSARDAGMIAYIGVNGAGLPVAAGSGVFGAATANPDTYNLMVAGQPFSVSDLSKGVIANDVNVFGVTLLSGPSSGTLSCNAQPQNTVAGICRNGTFTYTPNTGSTATSDSFTYCANNAYVPATTTTAASCSSTALTATVTLGASTLAGNPSAVNQTYTAASATYIKIQSPGLLLGNSDPSGLPLSVVVPTTLPAGVVMDAKGGFIATVTSGTASTSFPYTVQNSQGRTASGTVTVSFPAPSNLQVAVVDAAAYQTYGCNPLSTVTTSGVTCPGSTTPLPLITDYRWIIEEDLTFWVDPSCTTNTSITTPGCPKPVATGGTIPTFGTNFHASSMGYVAQGCTGPLSCESGQTMLDTRAVCTSPGVPTGCTTTPGMHIPAVCDLGNGACRPDPNCTALPCLTSGGTTPVLPSSIHLDPTKRYYISILPGDAANPYPANVSAPQNCLAGPVIGGALNTACGHSMGGAPIAPACNIYLNSATTPCTATTTLAFTTPVTVKVAPTPFPTSKLSVIVFEDDFPLNGEQDGGGGNGTVAPIEPGLGGFEIILWDTFGGLGDFTGQDTHDMFNQPLSNALAGTIDPSTGLDACPIAAQVTSNVVPNAIISGILTSGTQGSNACTPTSPCTCTTTNACTGDGTQAGITGRIVTCPKFESDNVTLSPLAGQALVANLMPDKFSVQAYPGADRIARGEEWLQTNTLDGQHPHDAFLRIGEPGYFQEFGPSGYHVAIGFASPAIINARYKDVCAGAYGAVGPCTNTIKGQADVQRLSRTPDQRLYPSGDREAFSWTQCWVSLGDPDAEDFMFTKCDANGNFEFKNVPSGMWRITIGDQWNDQIIDGLSTPANVGCTSNAPNGTVDATTCPGGATLQLGNIGVQQWQSNLYTRYYVDDNKNGVMDPGELGIQQVYTRIRYRDGSNANALLNDPNGVANFNETFPLFNWYVVEPDLGRYKRTGTHTVYDAGGPADGSSYCGTSNGARQCGTSTAYNYLANTYEGIPLPADLSVPGAVYCASADCATESASFAAGIAIPSSSTASSGRIDPPWVNAEGWSGMTSQGNWIEFGVAPYAACNPALPPTATGNFCAAVKTTAPGATTATTTYVGENGGIHGHTTYAATRPFDDASQMIEQPWAPNVARVRVNLYQEGFAADGVTPTLTMVDTTTSSSWDDWAQGFYPGSTAGSGTGAGQKPYMSCPGQGTATGTNADLFWYSLYDQPQYLDLYNSQHNGGTLHTLPYNSQYKCYDAMHIWNQIQPAPYDGEYSFPSSLGVNATTGKPLPTMGSTNGAASSLPGTNCTVCVKNPDTTDVYRVGTPMLPPGKYVVEVIMPPGYEVYKEEDKNLLIGDNYIAPATVQFAGLGGSIFIIPDQASVASLYEPGKSGFNPSNYQNSTTSSGLNEELSGVPGTPGFQDPVWPCVGEMRVVPDYLSLFPQAKETAPFAGATRPLCDRKEVTLADQMGVSAKFYIYTSTHIAAKFTGVITNDFTSEFDPFSPQFGEKFSPPNLPISTKDYLGNEISRVYADHWGTYESLNFSTWEVNPPNITGYSPTMMVQCMNDAGPILDTRATIPDPNNPANSITNPTFGQMVTDPLYNAHYSQFCYEEPYMPGLTTYLDTPVVPTSAFVGAAYNDVDCAYPDTTPAIKEVDGDSVAGNNKGPWVSAAGHTLTITALGNTLVDNSAYAGPSANAVPFDLKKVQRHYGFGTAQGTVTIGGIIAPVSAGSWSDSLITVTVPSGVANCPVQQQAQYGGSTAQCGELIITSANTAAAGAPSNAKQSIDAVTVIIGGKAPIHVSASQTIQSAVDAAMPGDLLMVDPASHNEMLIMWKPVRLQGVGAASSIINANATPAGKLLDPWRRTINCLFGLSLSGVPIVGNGTGAAAVPYDSTGTYNCTSASGMGAAPVTGPNGDTWNYFTTPYGTNGVPQIDRLPLEAVVGWNATVNGNLAEQLQEPSLMGAYEGAGITVLGKGVWTSPGENVWSDTAEGGAFPPDALLLQDVPIMPDDEGAALGPQYSYCFTTAPTGSTTMELAPNPYPSNFECNPASIDGLSVTNSSQGGGGIFVHGWAHNLQIANNRVYNNAGTLSGGMSIGQGEFPIALNVVVQEGSTAGVTAPIGAFVPDNPPSCLWIPVIGAHLPYCLDVHVNVHNNYIANNASLGDELFSGTLSGGGGATLCTGSDYYKFNYNWVCGNQSSGEGGGIVHLGFIYDGDIEHNAILLNQSINPTIPTNGGGISIQGTPDTDPVCGALIDQDCPPGLSDGTGPNLVINANLIQANSADSGAGGGIRLNQVNGTDISTFPNGCVIQGAGALTTCPRGGGGTPASTYWNSVSITNNIINNNVAGWDGAGISLQDSLNVSIVNNTIAHNDSLASSGVLTQSIGTPQASAPAGNCTLTGPTGANTASCPQPAGVSSTLNSALLTSSFPVAPAAPITCPAGQTPATGCRSFSDPIVGSNIIWQNRSFQIGISAAGTGNLNQQNLVSLYNASFGGGVASLAPAQTATGECFETGNSYWDIGVRGDTGPTNHSSGRSLTPTYSVLTSLAGGYGGGSLHNSASAPPVISQYCNGSRVPPECSVADGCGGPSGFGVPPGIADATTPNPVFSLTPSATVDEGNNWINVSWGPLALADPAVPGPANPGATSGDWGGGPLLANYSLSSSIDTIPTSVAHPTTDFFGNPRPETGSDRHFDPGAVEAQANVTITPTLTSIVPNTGLLGTTVAVVINGTNLSGATAVAAGAGITATVTGTSGTSVSANFVISTTAPETARAVTVTVGGVAVGGVTFTVAGPTITSISPNSGERGGAPVPVTITGTNLTGATAVNAPGSPNITVTNFVAVSATTVTATLNLAPATTLGAHNITVTTPSGATNAVTFTVTGAAAPTFSAPTPALTTTPANTTAKTGTITVTNPASSTGPLNLTAAPIIVRNTGTGAYTITGGTCVSGLAVAPGATCTIVVHYAPATTATSTAHVTLTDTGATTATQNSANFNGN